MGTIRHKDFRAHIAAVAKIGRGDPQGRELAVRAGRLAFLAGRIPRKMYATASSPVEGLVGR